MKTYSRKLNKVRYWATSKDMIKIHYEDSPNKAWLEYNPHIRWNDQWGNNKSGMWRINAKGGVPLHLAGYSNHKQKLVEQLEKGW